MNDFKIPQKYLIDFDTLKVGDRVWCVTDEYVTIDSIDISLPYPIVAGSVCYTKDGKRFAWDKYPSLFRSNPFDDLREEFFQDTLMEVRDEDGEDWKQLPVFGKTEDLWLVWDLGVPCWGGKKTLMATYYRYARPISPPSEEFVHLTLKDISEGKGVGVPAHLIRIKE